MEPSPVPSTLTPETIAWLNAVAGEMYDDGTLFPREEAKLVAIRQTAVAKVERLIASGMPRLEAYEVVGVEVGRTARTVRDWLHTAGSDQ